MPAFQLSPCAAALVSDTSEPSVTLVCLSGSGLIVNGRAAVEQLKAACELSLQAQDAKKGGAA